MFVQDWAMAIRLHNKDRLSTMTVKFRSQVYLTILCVLEIVSIRVMKLARVGRDFLLGRVSGSSDERASSRAIEFDVQDFTIDRVANLGDDSSTWWEIGRYYGDMEQVMKDELTSIRELKELISVVEFKGIVRIYTCGEDTCSVCLCEFKMEELVRQLPRCSHVFHKQCLDSWLDCRHTSCPLCRTALLSD